MNSKPSYFQTVAILGGFIIIFSVLACAHKQAKRWYSQPAEQTITRQNVRVDIGPLKRDNPYYVSFRLSIANNTAIPIEVDWNQTRYLHKGNDLGVFVFQGIDPKTIKDAIPPDTIAAGETFTREIFPLRTIAFLPRDQTPGEGRLGFLPGILPAGENGVLLVLRQGNRKIRQTLSVRLRAETISK